MILIRCWLVNIVIIVLDDHWWFLWRWSQIISLNSDFWPGDSGDRRLSPFGQVAMYFYIHWSVFLRIFYIINDKWYKMYVMYNFIFSQFRQLVMARVAKAQTRGEGVLTFRGKFWYLKYYYLNISNISLVNFKNSLWQDNREFCTHRLNHLKHCPLHLSNGHCEAEFRNTNFKFP